MNKIKKLIFNIITLGIYKKIQKQSKLENLVQDLREIVLSYKNDKNLSKSINPLNKFGKKCFSQTDEDGITIEILRRINHLEKGTFAEFGPGNGMENNTLLLKSLGWKGFWVGNENLKFNVKNNDNFIYIKEFITLKNIIQLAMTAKKEINVQNLDVISLDLDGNDFHLVNELLKNNFRPKLFIVEYNAKFPPPIKWIMNYNEKHFWDGTDYFGASLSSFVDLFEKKDYFLACCNFFSGANAFFVDLKYKEFFKDIPNEISEIYVPPRYMLPYSFGHSQSIKTISSLFD